MTAKFINLNKELGMSPIRKIENDNECCENIYDMHGWDCKYRKILWVVLILNIIMFVVEFIAGIYSESQSLLADALDFLGDSGNYAISLYVLNRSIVWRAKTAIFKGVVMSMFGLYVLASTIYKSFVYLVPQAEVMGAIGALALIVNVISAALLYKYRSGDSNRESVWVCSRNDALGNVAVILASIGVFYTRTRWPDLLVAFIIVFLALSGAFRIINSAQKDLKRQNL